MSERVKAVLTFWFGVLEDDHIPKDRQALWWAKDSAVDQEISHHFGEVLDRAATGALDSWQSAPRSCLALIVVLDQFSRNIFRDNRRAFAQDAIALDVCLRGIERGMDFSLRPIERVFFYMPMMHAESLEMQRRSVKVFEELYGELPENLRGEFETFPSFARQHCEIVARFGRFPHRNKILGRASSPAELEFLKSPGSSF